MKRIPSSLLFACACLVVAAPVIAAGVDVGDTAPDFTLTDLAGNAVSLSDFDGNVRVLEWTNPDCPFVKRHYEAKTMTTLAKRYASKDVVWLTINSTHYMGTDANAEFAKKYGIAAPVLVDQDGTVGKKYGARTTPHLFVIDATGTVVYAGAIDDDPRGTSSSTTNYVNAALEATLEGKEVGTAATKPYGCSVKYK